MRRAGLDPALCDSLPSLDGHPAEAPPRAEGEPEGVVEGTAEGIVESAAEGISYCRRHGVRVIATMPHCDEDSAGFNFSDFFILPSGENFVLRVFFTTGNARSLWRSLLVASFTY